MHLSITKIVHDLIRPHVQPGDTALDGTAGNGHDTLFLAQCVGPMGRVIAWDIQPVALERTAALLAQHAVTWVELIHGDHGELDLSPFSVSERGLGGEVRPPDDRDLHLHAGRPHPPAPSPKRRGGERSGFSAAMFNLGYLPAGDKSIRTSAANSVRAIRAAVERLVPGGILTVLAYTGHAGGAEEADAVAELLAALPPETHCIREVTFPTGRTPPPRLFAVESRSS